MWIGGLPLEAPFLLQGLFGTITLPVAVAAELDEGRRAGVAVPDPARMEWMPIATPASGANPKSFRVCPAPPAMG